MKYFFLSLILVVFASCSSTSDNETIIGNWKLYRFQKGKDVLLSDDPVEARKIIDKHVKANEAYIKNIKKFRDNAEKEMFDRLNVFFEFRADSTMLNSDITTGIPDIQQWNYLLDEAKHELTMTSESDKRIYKYQLKDEQLILTESGSKITFQRKSEARDR